MFKSPKSPAVLLSRRGRRFTVGGDIFFSRIQKILRSLFIFPIFDQIGEQKTFFVHSDGLVSGLAKMSAVLLFLQVQSPCVFTTKQTFHVCSCGFLCQNCFLDSYIIYNYEYLRYPETCMVCARPLSDKKRETLRTYIKNYYESEIPMAIIDG